MSVHQLQTQLTAHEISEWAAFYRTQDKDWKEAYVKNLELEQSRDLTKEEKAARLKTMLKGNKKRGNNRKPSR